MSRRRWAVLLAVAVLAAACGDARSDQPAGAVLSRPTAPRPSIELPSPSTTLPEAGPTSIRDVSPAEPLQVWVVGDSVTYELEPAIAAALRSTGEVEVVDGTLVGFGLTLDASWNWREGFAGDIARLDPDVVVFQVGTWDANDDVLASAIRSTEPSSPTFDADYAELWNDAVDVLTARDAHVYWLTMLPSDPPDIAGRLNRLVAELAAGDDRVTLVDLDPVLVGPDGLPLLVLEDPDGSARPVRKVDGVHVCRDGAALVADTVVARVVDDWALPELGSWRDGEWRRDPRYDVDPCPTGPADT